MRKVPLAAIVLGAMVILNGRAAVGVGPLGGCLGWGCGGGFYPPAYYPVPVYPYPYDYSYFRPDGVYGWNANRNWRDTWQDDGVKVHGYTLR